MIPSMTPIYPDPSTSYFSPRPTTPAKRLRSCLSPTRTPSGSTTPIRPSSSRTNSTGSEYSMPSLDGWRRRKSVRWEGGENDEDCAVTSYHATWSATEYDRTPLEPPSEAERTCVLPERGSRTLFTTYDCFHDSPAHAALDPDEEDFEDLVSSSTSADDITQESLILATPHASEPPEHEEAPEAHDEEDRQWEECMERRRMMFAMRSKSDEFERQPEFEGYRSISAKLVDMLRSIEARRLPSPEEEDEEEHDCHQIRSQIIQEEDEENEGHDDDLHNVRLDEEEDDDEAEIRSFSSFTFTNLQSLKISPPVHGNDDERLETDTESTDIDPEAATPSLISSAESEGDISLVSPRPSLMATPPYVAITGIPGYQREKTEERAMMEISPAVAC